MKPSIAALLLVLSPLTGSAQNPSSQHTKAKKLEWIGIGALAGGISGTVIGVVKGKEVTQSSTVCVYLQTLSAAATPPSGCIALTGIAISQPGVSTTSVGTTISQHRATDWKIAGPAIGAAGAGALLLELGHLQVKRAELSIRPDGAVRVAFRW